MPDARRTFTAPDGRLWGVEVRTPGSSNAMIVFASPNHRTARLDRYAWYNWTGVEAGDVTGHLDPEQLLRGLSQAELFELFRRSMPISPGVNPLAEPVWVPR